MARLLRTTISLTSKQFRPHSRGDIASGVVPRTGSTEDPLNCGSDTSRTTSTSIDDLVPRKHVSLPSVPPRTKSTFVDHTASEGYYIPCSSDIRQPFATDTFIGTRSQVAPGKQIRNPRPKQEIGHVGWLKLCRSNGEVVRGFYHLYCQTKTDFLTAVASRVRPDIFLDRLPVVYLGGAGDTIWRRKSASKWTWVIGSLPVFLWDATWR